MSAPVEKDKFPFRFSLIFSFVFLFLYWPGIIMLPINGVFTSMEASFHDYLFVVNSDSGRRGDSRIVMTAMDDETGKRYGFPLPRAVQGRIIDRLREAGAKTVVFDVIFPEKREGDEEFAAATKRHGQVIHLFALDTQHSQIGTTRTVEMPVEPLVKSAYDLGYPNVDGALDPDGHVRRYRIFEPGVADPRRNEGHAASVSAVAFSAYTGMPLSEIREKWSTPLGRKLVLNFRVPTKWLRHPWRLEGDRAKNASVEDLREVEAPYRVVSALDLLDGKLTGEQKKALKGALVIVGSTSIGYFDHTPTPFNPRSPGAEIHMTALDNMLHDDFFKPVARIWFVLIILAFIWAPMLLMGFSPAWGAAVMAGVAASWIAFGLWGFRNLLYIEFFGPTAALVCSFLVQTVHKVLAEGREKKRIKGLFGQFVAPEVVEDLANNPEKAKLGGEKKEMTMLFLDIAHFTTISEKMPPEALIVFLNKYLSALSQVILDRKAVVGNYIGDCIMAFWNAPILSVPDHRAQACLAAIECQAMMAKLNEQLDPNLPEKPAIRIGLNSGFVTVGLTGSEKKLQYTTLGDEVNLSSRLEGANKFFGSDIMVSESTFEGAKDVVEARELGRVRVVGKATPIRVYELLGKKGQLSPQWQIALERYNKGLNFFIKRKYDEAVLEFQEVLKVFPNDGPASLYLGAARDYAAIPPEENWDGVFNLTAK